MNFKAGVNCFLTVLMLFIFSSCKEKVVEEIFEPVVTLVEYTGCKNLEKKTVENLSVPAKNNDCVEYQYDGSDILYLSHKNAGFNCCPGKIVFDIEVSGNTIIITEKETEALCYCLCLFDLEYEIRNIKPGVYNLIFIEPYINTGGENGKVLEFMIDLNSTDSGSYCVERENYPW